MCEYFNPVVVQGSTKPRYDIRRVTTKREEEPCFQNQPKFITKERYILQK